MKSTKLKTTGLVLMSLGLAIVSTGGVLASAQKGHLGQVLGDSTLLAQLPSTGTSFLPTGTSGATVLSPLFQVNIPAVFADAVTLASLVVEEESVFNGQARFVDEVILENGAELLGNLDANGIDINVGTGEITASNLVYSVIAGGGIEVSGDQDLTITNTDRGSAQKIFSKVKVGSDTAEAGSNTDTFEFASGDGISLSLNTSDKKLTITGANQSGWYKASSSNVVLLSNADSVGIGTSSPTNKLEIDSGTDGASGISFTRITSSTAAGVGGGKVLSVDSGGKVILVQDQTGDSATPSAEAVLPSATNGMTLYFNGLNWAASNNLFHDGGSVGISTTSPVSRFHVFTNLATKIGQIIQGYSGQTANLTEWRDSSGSVLSYIDANGVFNGSANVAGSLNPGLTNGSVLFQGSSGITQDNSNLFWNDSTNRLGIGTSSPSAPLNVLSTSIFSPAIEIGNAYGAYAPQLKINYSSYEYSGTDYYATISHNGIGSGVDSLGGLQFVAQAPNGSVHASNNFVFGKKVGTGTPTTLMIIKGQNGNVGIGTTAPAAKFEVNALAGASGSEYNLAILGDQSHWAGTADSLSSYMLAFTASAYNGTFLDNVTAAKIGFIKEQSWNGVSSVRDAALVFQTALDGTVAEKVRITSGGNVGIGTTSPSSALEIGSGVITIPSGAMGGPSIAFAGNTNTGIYKPAVNQIGFAAGGSPALILNSNSSATFGQWGSTNYTIAPGSGGAGNDNRAGTNLILTGGQSTGDQTGGSLIFQTSPAGTAGSVANTLTTRMTILGNGNVGIGTTTPSTNLHVRGYGGANESVNGSDSTLLLESSTTASNGVGPVLRFLGQSGNGANPYSFAWIKGAKESASAGNYSGYLSFVTTTAAGGYSERMRMTSYGIGAGTNNPSGYFHINGGYGANDAFTVNQTLGGNILSASASGSTKFLISNAGRVGIGTLTPGAQLDLDAPGSVGGVLRLGNSATAIDPGMFTGKIEFYKGDDSGGAGVISNIKARSVNAGQNFALDFDIGSSASLATVLTLAWDGATRNVGIGTTVPGATLAVYPVNNSVDSMIVHAGDANSVLRTLGRYTAIGYASAIDNTTVLRITSAGTESTNLVKMQTGSASRKGLVISGYTSQTANLLEFQDVSGNILGTFDESGNLGIGTSNPGALLNVKSAASRSSSGQEVLRLSADFGSGTPGSGPAITFGDSTNAALGRMVFAAESDNGAGFGFWTMSSGFSVTEKLRISGGGNIGIGTTSPTALLHVNGGYGANDALTINQTLSGNILSASASGTTKFVISNGGRVGIGTNNPVRPLEISDSSSAGIRLSGGTSQVIDFGSSANQLIYANSIISIVANSANALNVTQAGNVGIGTTVPAAALSIGNASQFQINSSGSIQMISGVGHSIQSSGGSLLIKANSGSSTIVQANSAADVVTKVRGVASQTGNLMQWEDSNGVALSVVNAGGNVGIGTTTPSEKLHVYGASGASGATPVAIRIDSSTNSQAWTANSIFGKIDAFLSGDGSGGGTAEARTRIASVVEDTTATDVGLSFYTSDGDLVTKLNERMRLKSNGYLGIGTTNPLANLHVETADNVTARFSSSTNAAFNIANFANYARLTGVAYDNGAYKSLQFETVSGGTMYLDTAGNVGIGTTTFGTSAAKVFALAGSTAPSTSITDGVQLFAVDVTGSHELQVRDEAGNVTTLSPHNFSQIEDGKSEDLAWSFYSERNGLAINADMTKALRVVEKLSGEKLVYIKNLTNGADLSEYYAEEATGNLETAQFVTQSELAPLVKLTNNTWTFISRVVFEKPAEFLAEVTFRGRVYFSDKDAAGQIIMKPGDTVAEVPFDHAFMVAPAVTLTTQNSYVRTTLAEVTPTGFKVTIESPQANELKITWTALAVTGLRTTEGRSEAPAAPAAAITASPSPSANLEPSPTTITVPSPSPEVAGASTSATPLPTPTSTPSE